MPKPKIIPITRNYKFFSQEDYELEIQMGREVIEGDGNFTVILYRVDREMTPSDIYNEARMNEVAYKPPVELKVINDGVKNYDNKHTLMGYKGAYRTITCAPVDYNEFTSE